MCVVVSALSELLSQSMPEGETARGLARKARDRGHKLSDATAKVYLRGGPHGTPSIETLRAFASVLSVTMRESARWSFSSELSAG